MFTVNQACIYKPNGQECQIMLVYGERHRARIKMANGQELDEIAWHDLEPRDTSAPLHPTPASNDVETPLNEIQENVRYEAEKPRKKFWPPRDTDA